MNMTNGKRVLAVLAVCALSLSMIAAAPSSADAPEALHNAQQVSGVLTGNAGGAFAFYKLDYPGDQSVVTIELRYVPADPVTNAAVGLNVYGPNGFFIGRGQMVEDTGGDGVLRLPYSDDNKATWLVQVYNYLPGHSLSYSIVAEGLPEAAATVTSAPAKVVATPEAPATTKLTGAGYLAGNHGGAYALYKVDVVADAPNVVVTMNWAPDDPDIAKGVGFVVYGPSGQVARATGTGTPGERKTTLPANAPGVYQVQVYNYIDGLTIQYTLSSAPITE
jgi:hypothetical protein